MEGGVEFRQFNVLLSECVARGQQNGIDCSRIEEEAASLFFVDALENREFGKRGLFPETCGGISRIHKSRALLQQLTFSTSKDCGALKTAKKEEEEKVKAWKRKAAPKHGL